MVRTNTNPLPTPRLEHGAEEVRVADDDEHVVLAELDLLKQLGD